MGSKISRKDSLGYTSRSRFRMEIFVIVLVSLLGCCEGYSSTYNPKEFSRNVSALIDRLLDNYDKSLRPGFGGKPLLIMVNMNVRSMGPFSEKHEEYSMQLYMRQVWYDSRLKFNKTDIGRSDFSMDANFAQNIWRPDTFFINGKKSYRHDITAPNMFVRLYDDGKIYMSMRLTIKATCVMHLRRFPLDTQICPLRLASYTYNARDVHYKWDPKLAIKERVIVDRDVQIAQYQLGEILTDEVLVTVRTVEEISTLTVKFVLQRLTGFFLLQVYVPCILIVCSSWVGFWITKKDVPGRVCLGVNNVLCMAKLGMGGRDIFPMVSHATALDYFVVLCFWCTFATMVEYAAINYLQRYAVETLNLLVKRQEKLRREREFLDSLIMEGAGCIRVDPSVHTFLKETFKCHIMAAPIVADAAFTEPPEPNPKSNLLSTLKLPLLMIPKARNEVDEKKVDEAIAKEKLEPVAEVPPTPHPHTPPPYTPRLLKRLEILKRRVSLTGKHGDVSHPEETLSVLPISHPDTQQPSTSRDTPTTIIFEEIEEPEASQVVPGLTIESEKPVCAQVGPIALKGYPPKQEEETVSTKIWKRLSLAAKDSSGGDDDEPKGPPKLEITPWRLIAMKKFLKANLKEDTELPNEEDLLDKFNMIDIYSRIIFPSFFWVLFTIYWVLFNYYIEDEFPGTKKPPSDGLVI